MNGRSQISANWVAQQFPDLQNLQHLSQGGQKQVFSALHPTDGEVVLKFMHPTADIERTSRELLAVAQIQCDRIPKILAQGTIRDPNGTHFWFREQRIDGQNVRECLATGTFDTVTLLRLALHISEVLVAAEAVYIVHRDVKPENIIRDRTGNFWLIDFGLSRHLGLESVTPTASVFGPVTWGYAPLEQCKNFKAQIDARADLFALGITLYECATGTNPFRAGARDELEILQRIENDPLPRVRLSFSSASSFSDLVVTLTQRRRIHRPPNAKEAYDWIKDICDRERVR